MSFSDTQSAKRYAAIAEVAAAQAKIYAQELEEAPNYAAEAEASAEAAANSSSSASQYAGNAAEAATSSSSSASAAAASAASAASAAQSAIGQTVRAPQGETLSQLPAAASRQNQYIATDSAGNVTIVPRSSIPVLDSNGKLPVSTIPAIALTQPFVVSSQSAMLALDAQPGDIAKRTDLGYSFCLAASPASTLSNWIQLTDDVLAQLGMSSGASQVGATSLIGASSTVQAELSKKPDSTNLAASNGAAAIGALDDSSSATTVQGALNLKMAIANLIGTGTGQGDKTIGVLQPFTWAVPRTQHDKNYDVINVMDFGAVWDGSVHALSSRYSTLAAAQAQYPFVTSLSDSLDWAALQSAVNAALTLTYGATIVIPRGKGVFGTNTITGTLTGFQGIRFEGQGTDISQLKTSVTGTNSLFNFTYTGSGWWIDASSANSVIFCDLSVVTDQTNAGYGLTINGGSLTGRPTRGTYLDRVTFRGESGLTQCFARSINLINTTYVFQNHCRYFQSLQNGNGIGFYARVNQLDGTNSQVCGGFYFTECEFIYGDAGIDLSSYTEGVYLTNCVADGGIKQGVRWLSPTAESGLQVIGGQYNCLNYCFNINNIIDGCINGADIRCNGGATGWRGISLILSHGFNITGNNFIGAAVSGLMGVYIDQNNFGSAYTTLVSSNRFTNMDYGVYMTSAATYNHVDSSNIYANVAIPVQDTTAGQNIVVKQIYSSSASITFTGGAATETKQITIPAGFFQATQKAECVFAKGSDNDLIGTYLYTSSSNTAVAAQVSFRLTTGGNIPAGTYRVMYQIS